MRFRLVALFTLTMLSSLLALACGENGKPRAIPSSPAISQTYAVPVTTEGRLGEDIVFRLVEMPFHQLPTIVDSNSPAFWDNGMLIVFNSTGIPAASTGPSLEALENPIYVQSFGFPSGGWWLEAVWRDDSSGVLYGWYHFEPDDLPCQTAPHIGATVSYDNGWTWEDRGFVLENGYDVDCEYSNGYFVGGNGDFTVIVDPENQYFYFLFSNYGGPVQEQGVAIARSAFTDRGQPGTVFKYYNGFWEEPGLGGRVTPLFATTTGWKGPEVESFWGPSVHWNSYLEGYVMLLNRTVGTDWTQEGVYITFSRDLLTWTEPQKILETSGWYPQVIGLGPGETDARAGRIARLYVGGTSVFAIEFEKQGAIPLVQR